MGFDSRRHGQAADVPADVAEEELALPLPSLEGSSRFEVAPEVGPLRGVGAIHAVGGGADDVFDLHSALLSVRSLSLSTHLL